MANVYHYLPLRSGLRLRSSSPADPLREDLCALYPDARRSRVFSPEEMETMERYPLRPVVFARMAPRYHLDLFNLSGISGFGRFVLTTDRETLFLDMCRHVETDYTDGELRYVLRDRLLGGGEIRISFVPAADAAGLLIEADLSEVPEGAQVWFLHGGMYGWNAHSTYLLPYSPAMCWDNTVTLLGVTVLR